MPPKDHDPGNDPGSGPPAAKKLRGGKRERRKLAAIAGGLERGEITPSELSGVASLRGYQVSYQDTTGAPIVATLGREQPPRVVLRLWASSSERRHRDSCSSGSSSSCKTQRPERPVLSGHFRAPNRENRSSSKGTAGRNSAGSASLEQPGTGTGSNSSTR